MRSNIIQGIVPTAQVRDPLATAALSIVVVSYLVLVLVYDCHVVIFPVALDLSL